MNLLKQFAIVLGIYFLGQVLETTLNLPIPGSVVGMILLLICLFTGIIKIAMIETVSDFFLDNLAFFFIPAGVGVIANFTLLKHNLFAIIFILLISTIMIISFTGLFVQMLMKGEKK